MGGILEGTGGWRAAGSVLGFPLGVLSHHGLMDEGNPVGTENTMVASGSCPCHVQRKHLPIVRVDRQGL